MLQSFTFIFPYTSIAWFLSDITFLYFSSLLAVCQTWRRTWDGSTCYGYLWKSNEGSVAWRNVWGKKDQSLHFLYDKFIHVGNGYCRVYSIIGSYKKRINTLSTTALSPRAIWDILGPMQLFVFHKYSKIPLIWRPWGLVRCQQIEHFRLSDGTFADLSLYLDCVTNQKSI